MVKVLIDYNSDVELTNKRGFTALVLAKFNGFKEIYDILKIANASESIINKLRYSNNIMLEKDKKYSYMDIIKKEIYCENDNAKKLVTNIFNNIEKYGDFRIELIMICIALYTLEKNKNGDNLQIFITNRIDISVFNGEKLDNMHMIGFYNVSRNIIQSSGFGGTFVATQTFLHELVHKIHLSFKDLKLDGLKKAVNMVLVNLEELSQSKGSSYIKDNLINRINNDSYYSTVSLKLLEYLADSISYIIIYKKYEGDVMVEDMKYILKPIYDVFDEEISKELKEYILRNENFGKIKLSNLMKKSLHEFENNIKERLNRKYVIQQIPSSFIEKEYTWDSFI